MLKKNDPFYVALKTISLNGGNNYADAVNNWTKLKKRDELKYKFLKCQIPVKNKHLINYSYILDEEDTIKRKQAIVEQEKVIDIVKNLKDKTGKLEKNKDGSGHFILGIMTLWGTLNQGDKSIALDYFEKARKLGFIPANIYLANILGTDILNNKRCHELYLEAYNFDNTNPNYILSLGTSFLNFNKVDHAIKMFQEADKLNDSSGSWNLGLVYSQKQDFVNAFYWFYRSNSLGNVDAKNMCRHAAEKLLHKSDFPSYILVLKALMNIDIKIALHAMGELCKRFGNKLYANTCYEIASNLPFEHSNNTLNCEDNNTIYFTDDNTINEIIEFLKPIDILKIYDRDFGVKLLFDVTTF